MYPRSKPAKFLGRGTKHTNHLSMSARPPSDYVLAQDTEAPEPATDPRPPQARQVSAAESSLSKLLDYPATTTTPPQTAASASSPTTQEPCNCNLTRKLSNIFRGSAPASKVSRPKSKDDAITDTDVTDTDNNAPPANANIQPAPAPGVAIDTEKKKNKSPARIIFAGSLFHSHPRREHIKEAFEELASDPVHGVKSHRLAGGKKEYTSFPAPRFENKSSDRVCEFIDRG